MCLKGKDINLEGHFVLDISSEHSEIFGLIKEIEVLTFQRIFFTGFKMFLPEERKVDERCLEQVRRRVHFSTNVVELRFDGFELQSPLIEHITQELYGEVEFSNSDATLSPKEQSTKGSSLEILSFNSKFAQDIKTLVRLNHLPQLRVLHLQGVERYCLGVLLGSGSPSLERFSLQNVTLRKQDVDAFFDILTRGGFPKLNCLNLHEILLDYVKISLFNAKICLKYGLKNNQLERLTNAVAEYVEVSLSDVKPLSRYGLEMNQIERLTKLEYLYEVTGAYLALEKDILNKTKLNQADTRSLVHIMLPTFTVLDLSNSSPIGCLGDFLKSHIFLGLSVLDLSNTNLCGIKDVRTVSTAFQESELLLLETLNLSNNTLTGSLGVLLANECKFLNTLQLEDTKLSVSDVQILSTATQEGKLLRLGTLNLSKNILTDSLGVLLANEFKFLHTLQLEDTKLSVGDVLVLSTATQEGKLPRLRTLNLSKNILTDTLHDLFKGAFREMETLLLEDTKPSVSDVLVLSTATQEGKLPRLRTLNLSKNILTNTLHYLFKVEFREMETLLLEDTKLSINDVQALSTAVQEGKLQWLRTLNLSKNILTDTLHDLFKGAFRKMDTLLLEDTKPSISDVLVLSTATQEGKLPRLRTLNLSKNILTDTLHDLFEVKFREMETLLLEDTKLSINDVQALSTAVQEGKLQCLRTLNLSKNILTDILHYLFKGAFRKMDTLLL